MRQSRHRLIGKPGEAAAADGALSVALHTDRARGEALSPPSRAGTAAAGPIAATPTGAIHLLNEDANGKAASAAPDAAREKGRRRAHRVVSGPRDGLQRRRCGCIGAVCVRAAAAC